MENESSHLVTGGNVMTSDRNTLTRIGNIFDLAFPPVAIVVGLVSITLWVQSQIR